MQCDLCDSWVHIACSNPNLYTYRKLQKTSLCMCCLRKELPYGSINDTKLRDLLHGEAIVSPYPKIISSIIKQSEYFDEEILKKANNSFYTLGEFLHCTEKFQSGITTVLYALQHILYILSPP